MTTSFNELNLNSKLIEALNKQNIKVPTEIQTKTIPLAIQNKDIIGQSQTGSGKTLAYLLPIFEKINTDKKEMQAIILAPTHELVMQIDSQIKMLSKNSELNVTSTTAIGEVNIQRQIDKLKEKPHIIIGSTGRILQLIRKRKITSHTIKTIVIDEGDKLLDQNNLNAVKDVVKTTMRDRQLMMFSASITEKAIKSAKALMKEPEVIQIETKAIVNPNIKHMYILSEQRDKILVLRKLLASLTPKKSIAFINRGGDIDFTTERLKYHHVNASSIFGNSSKEDRKKALNDFRTGKTKLLIASDVAARGLDIKEVSHIFNLDLPEDPMEYLHRCGRTGRGSDLGTTISIVTDRDLSLIKEYEKKLNIEILEKHLYKGEIIDDLKKKTSTSKKTKDKYSHLKNKKASDKDDSKKRTSTKAVSSKETSKKSPFDKNTTKKADSSKKKFNKKTNNANTNNKTNKQQSNNKFSKKSTKK